MPHELVLAISPEDLKAYHDIRRDVLWTARGRTGYDDKYPGEYAPDRYQFLLKFNGTPIGTTRLDDWQNGIGVFRLVAIREDVQGKGHGRVMAEMLYDRARARGIKTLYVNAAATATGYYQKLGWDFHEWDKEELAGAAVDCIQMKLDL